MELLTGHLRTKCEWILKLNFTSAIPILLFGSKTGYETKTENKVLSAEIKCLHTINRYMRVDSISNLLKMSSVYITLMKL